MFSKKGCIPFFSKPIAYKKKEVIHSPQQRYFDFLPNETLQNILKYLSKKELLVLQKINLRFSNNISEVLEKRNRQKFVKTNQLLNKHLRTETSFSFKNKEEALTTLTLLTKYNSDFFAPQNTLALRQKKLGFFILQLAEIMLYFNRNDFFKFPYLMGTIQRTIIPRTPYAMPYTVTVDNEKTIDESDLEVMHEYYQLLCLKINEGEDEQVLNRYLYNCYQLLKEMYDLPRIQEENFSPMFQLSQSVYHFFVAKNDKDKIYNLMQQCLHFIQEKIKNDRVCVILAKT